MPYYSETITLCGGAASVKVRETIGLDLIDAAAIYPALDYNRKNARQRKRAERFTEAYLRSEVTGDLGFPWPTNDDDLPTPAEDQAQVSPLQAAFEGFMALGTSDMATWVLALERVNKKRLNPNS